MGTEYVRAGSNVEQRLQDLGIHLPIEWMVEFILGFAEDGSFDPDDLQDLSTQIRSDLDAGTS